KVGVGKLEPAPGHITSRAFERNEDECERDKPRKNSRSKGKAATENPLSALPGLLNKAEDLERNDRQNARHQIQNESSEETKEKKGHDTARSLTGLGGSHCRCSKLPGGAVVPVRGIRKNNNTRHCGQISVGRVDRYPKCNLVAVA